LICSYCDRANHYCSTDCATKARRQSLRRANRKYAGSTQGKFNNALRQKRYRQRQAEKVTDQGSSSEPVSISLTPSVVLPRLRSLFSGFSLFSGPFCRICHFCLGQISDFIRNDFLRRQSRHRRG
jgi:hypothetical protein